MLKDLTPKRKDTFDLFNITDLPDELKDWAQKSRDVKFVGLTAKIMTLFAIKQKLSTLEVAVGLYRISNVQKTKGAIYQQLFELQKKGLIIKAKEKNSPWVVKPETLERYMSKNEAKKDIF